MTSIAVDSEPACPASIADVPRHASPEIPVPRRRGPFVAVRRPFDSIATATWDELAARTPWSTPFSRWAFHRSWWDAYGATAHEQTVVVVDPADATATPLGIVPLMHRHVVEATDATTHTTMRHVEGPPLTFVAPSAKATFFGASYHADYATILAAPADLPAVSAALAAYMARDVGEADDPQSWEALDLRRLRCGDPAGDALLGAFRKAAPGCGWSVTSEREDVCPVVTLPAGADFEGFLSTLGKKERHEIRRKIRRAEAFGAVELTTSTAPLTDLDDFIELHQKRWGADGLFPTTSGGDCSRRFVRHLFRHFGPNGPLRLTRLTIGGRLVASGIHFDDGITISYYNAGVDPDARDLSPGVVMVGRYIEQAIAAGRRRVDFLRGNEPYKYEWGAVDEPIQRLLVVRAHG